MWGTRQLPAPHTPLHHTSIPQQSCPHLCRRAPHRRPLHVCNLSVSSNDCRPGTTVEVEGTPYKVVEFLHVKPGKGSAFVRTKLKNFLNGSTVDKTFRAGEQVNLAEVARLDAQYSYQDGAEYVFMDNGTYEEHRLGKDSTWADYITEGSGVQLMAWNGKIISVDLPNVVPLRVDRIDNVKSAQSKPACLETGAMIQVPLFVKEGEVIKVDTRTGDYVGRT